MAFDPARAKSLFLAASDIADPAGRAAYLDRECGGDADLRARVEALLRADDAPVASDATGTYRAGEPETGTHGAGEPATGTYTPGAAAPVPTSEYPGRGETAWAVVGGKYTLVEPIGEGGMGSVWRAKQTEPVKRIVAVKLIKAGMDSRQVLARFEAERQALALMDHPNVAKVLDAGATPDGRPFFVMELVKGVPITEYCDARRLTPRERLDLFVPVCQAIQHAHQKGLIHRDIKPSNVLVALYDDRPVVKVIDFGVAKATGAALTKRTIDTGFGGVVGTPQYMSPEQATFNNLDIDTRSDVYALGVLLYEMLAGSPPFSRKDLEQKGLLEVLRVVREEEPPRPSTKLSTADALPTLSANRGTEPKRLTGLLRNELDWVVMKALEKDRARRYETANAFAADVQRYLCGEAVQAHPPSAAYRLRKFVRRNKGRVTAAGLLLVALLGGITGTSLGLVEAREQEKEAKTQEKSARDESAEKEKARAAAAERVKERDAALKAEGERSDELRHRLGVGTMVLASAAYENRDYWLAAERLDAVPAGQRGWEWRNLRRQLDGGIFTLRGHASTVTSVAVSPDGTRLVTAAGDHDCLFVAKVWDARTGQPLFDLKGAPQSGPKDDLPTVCVAFSTDGTRIVTTAGDEKARIWDAATGTLRLELTEPLGGGVTCAAFSPDGTRVATTTTAGVVGVVRVWDARTAKPLHDWRAHQHEITSVSFSPDGTRLVTGGNDRAVRVWDAGTGASRLEAKGMMSPHSSVAFSPDGARLVAGREDGTARVIDARTGEVLLVLRGRPRVSHALSSATSGVLSVAFSPDGTRVVTAGTTGGFGTGEASVWDARTGVELLELKGHTAMVMSAAFSPDGERVITGSLDGTAKLWDARTGTPRFALAGVNSRVHAAAMSTDGHWLVTGGGDSNKSGEATIWDARTGLPKFALSGFKGTVHGVAVSRDGTRVVTGGGTNRPFTSTAPGGPIRIGPGNTGGPIRIGPGGAAPARPDAGEATVWDARTGEPLVRLKGLKQVVGSVSISKDGTRVVTAAYHDPGSGGGSELRVWDATTGTPLLDLSQPDRRGGRGGERGGSVSFSPDGSRFIAGGVRNATMTDGAEACVRDAATGKVLVELKANQRTILGVAYSADGTRIATAHYDKSAAVWDAAEGTLVVELKGHTGNVNSVAFSPDGKRVVTGSSDRTARVWDVQTGTTLAELKAHTGAVASVSFSADGSQILSAGHASPARRGEVFVWDAPAPRGDADAVEIAYRQLHTRPDPSRSRAAYLAARATKDDFAAAFHLNLVPPGERKAVVEQGDTDALAALNARADEYVGSGRPDEAIPLFVEILAATQARLGPEVPATARAMDSLGRLYHQTGQFAKAIPPLEGVVKYRKGQPDDPETPNAIGMLGLAYKDAGRLKDAAAVLEEAAENDDGARQHLLDVYALAGEHGKVVAVCRGQLDRLRTEKDEGAVIDSKAHILVRLGKAHLAQKKWADAENRLWECVTVLGKVEPEDWRIFQTRSLLGEVLVRQQKYAEAEPLLVKGYEGLKKCKYELQPQDAPLLPAALDRLIDLYTAMNKPTELAKWRTELARYPLPVAPPPREKG